MLVLSLLSYAALLGPSSLLATDIFWNVAGPADWNAATNWSPSTRVPGANGNASDVAHVANGGTATIAGDTPAVSEIDVGDSGSANLTNTVNHTAGMMTASNLLAIGLRSAGPGVYNQSGGTVNNVPVQNPLASQGFWVGEDFGTAGTYNLSAGTLNASMAGQDSYIGAYGNGTFNQSGNSVANFQQNAATADHSALYLGLVTGSTGHYNLQAGTLNASSSLIVGLDGNGAFTQTGGTVNAAADLDIQADTGAGVYNLKGGTLNVAGGGPRSGSGFIFSAGGGGTFNFTGGMLKVLSYSMGTNLVQNGSDSASTLDVTGNDTTIYGGYDINGGSNGAALTVGNGHALSVQGELSVQGGTVTITQTSGTITTDLYFDVANGAANGAFNLSGGSVTFGAGGFHVADQGGIGALDLSGTGVINASATDDFFVANSSGANGTVNQTGGTLHIRSGGNLVLTNDVTASGIYNLKGGTLDAGGATIAKGPGNGFLVFTGGTLKVAAVAADMFDMTQDATDGNSTLDATGNNTNVNVNYTAAVASGANTATVNVGSGQTLTMAPAKNLSFGNQSLLQGNGTIIGGAGSSLVYGSNLSSTFTGTIAGATVLATTGAGSLTLSGPNSYTGGTIVGGGTLTTTATGSLGSSSGSLAINAAGGGAAILNLGNNQTVGSLSSVVAGTGSSATLNIGAATTLTVNQTTTTQFAGTLVDSGTLANSGSGTLEIDGAPTFVAGSALQANAGMLRFKVTSGQATVGSGVTATVASGATLELAGTVSALSSAAAAADRVNIANSSQAPAGGLLVSGMNQQVGAIDGTGNVVVGPGASLTANHIRQNALAIGGTSTQAALVTIAASDAGGNPLFESPSVRDDANGFIWAESRSAPPPFGFGIAPSSDMLPSEASLSLCGSSTSALLILGAVSSSGRLASVPEPSTLAMLVGAMLALLSGNVTLDMRRRIGRRPTSPAIDVSPPEKAATCGEKKNF